MAQFGGTVRSSLVYQLLLLAHQWYFRAFLFAEVLIFVYKFQIVPYPTRNVITEAILAVCLFVIEKTRIYFGRRGNITESPSSVSISIALTVPALACAIYALLWQTYVLRLEVILVSGQLVFITFETIFAIAALATFAR